MNAKYVSYIHSAAWKRRAKKRLELDNHTCCVCGIEATEVHHLTYAHFRNEPMDDLVSLCRKCHDKAESLSNSPPVPGKGHNFLAALREDTKVLAPEVLEYLQEARGRDFMALMSLRKPDDPEGRKYWNVLKKAVRALCAKRYDLNCVEDRKDIAVEAITGHTCVVCLSQIEHDIRNSVQGKLHDAVLKKYAEVGKWKTVAERFGISMSTLSRLRDDDGTPAGPSPRETVFFYCGIDALMGISPLKGFSSLTEKDYKMLQGITDYVLKESA